MTKKEVIVHVCACYVCKPMYFFTKIILFLYDQSEPKRNTCTCISHYAFNKTVYHCSII